MTNIMLKLKAEIVGGPPDAATIISVSDVEAVVPGGRSRPSNAAARIDAIKTPRVKIVKRGSQSFSSLAKRSAIEYDADNMLRLLNRAFPDGDIKSLDRLKIVTVDD